MSRKCLHEHGYREEVGEGGGGSRSRFFYDFRRLPVSCAGSPGASQRPRARKMKT